MMIPLSSLLDIATDMLTEQWRDAFDALRDELMNAGVVLHCEGLSGIDPFADSGGILRAKRIDRINAGFTGFTPLKLLQDLGAARELSSILANIVWRTFYDVGADFVPDNAMQLAISEIDACIAQLTEECPGVHTQPSHD